MIVMKNKENNNKDARFLSVVGFKILHHYGILVLGLVHRWIFEGFFSSLLVVLMMYVFPATFNVFLFLFPLACWYWQRLALGRSFYDSKQWKFLVNRPTPNETVIISDKAKSYLQANNTNGGGDGGGTDAPPAALVCLYPHGPATGPLAVLPLLTWTPELQHLVTFTPFYAHLIPPFIWPVFLRGCYTAGGREVISKTLQAHRSVLVFGGGLHDAFLTDDDDDTDTGNNKNHQVSKICTHYKGYVKSALEEGVPILPAYAFGLKDAFPVESRKLDHFTIQLFGLGIPFWAGGNHGFPVRANNQIRLVIGDPVFPDNNDDDKSRTAATVDSFHQQVMDALVKDIYEKEKKYSQYDKERHLCLVPHPTFRVSPIKGLVFLGVAYIMASLVSLLWLGESPILHENLLFYRLAVNELSKLPSWTRKTLVGHDVNCHAVDALIQLILLYGSYFTNAWRREEVKHSSTWKYYVPVILDGLSIVFAVVIFLPWSYLAFFKTETKGLWSYLSFLAMSYDLTILNLIGLACLFRGDSKKLRKTIKLIVVNMHAVLLPRMAIIPLSPFVPKERLYEGIHGAAFVLGVMLVLTEQKRSGMPGIWSIYPLACPISWMIWNAARESVGDSLQWFVAIPTLVLLCLSLLLGKTWTAMVQRYY